MKTIVCNYSNSPCPDSLFGQIENVNNIWQWKTINKIRKDALQLDDSTVLVDEVQILQNQHPRLILVLESPHYSEFNQAGIPICAANGETGSNIYLYLCNVLNNVGKFSNNSSSLTKFLNSNIHNVIDVYVVNSISYQCSLGLRPINHIIKESNWVDEWYSSRNDFIKRCKSPVVSFFANLCTSGVYIPMKKIVKEELVANVCGNTSSYCEGPHPSTWSYINRVKFH